MTLARSRGMSNSCQYHCPEGTRSPVEQGTPQIPIEAIDPPRLPLLEALLPRACLLWRFLAPLWLPTLLPSSWSSRSQLPWSAKHPHFQLLGPRLFSLRLCPSNVARTLAFQGGGLQVSPNVPAASMDRSPYRLHASYTATCPPRHDPRQPKQLLSKLISTSIFLASRESANCFDASPING